MNLIVIITFAFYAIGGSFSEMEFPYVNDSVDPCDDFYQYACGNFGKYHTRPQNQSTLDLFTMTEDELVEIGIEILGAPKNLQDTVALNKAKSAYQACIDTPNYDYYNYPEISIIEEFGGMPLLNLGNSTKLSFTEIGKLAGTFGIPQLFNFRIKNFDPEGYIIIMAPDKFDPPGMIRPRSTKTYDEAIEESLKKIAQVKTRLLGEKEPLEVLLFKIAEHLSSKVSGVTAERLTNDLQDVKNFMTNLFNGGIIDDEMIPLNISITVKDLQDWTQKQFGNEIDINWLDYINQNFKWSNINIKQEEWIYLYDLKFVYGILNLVRKTDPNVVKNFVLLKTFLYMAPDSDLPVRQAFEEYYRSSGFQFYERPEYCSRKILDITDSSGLSFAVAENFVRYHFDINKIPKAVKIINEVRTVFKQVVASLNWLDEKSSNSIIQKLDNIVVDFGYPDFVENINSLEQFYENIKICEWDHYGNARRIRAFKHAYTLSQYVNHNIWTTSPFEVNAFAIRPNNKIMAPISILQSSYFNGSNLIHDYSRFGSIIAHEFIHHFDSVGVTYDADAFQKKLLTDSALETFQSKIQCFIDQYYRFYVPEIDAYVNGTRTLDENLADHGGLTHAFAVFTEIIDRRLVENSSKKYTLEQQFFLSFATQWCSDDSAAYLQKLIEDDPHTPNRYRVLGTLSNMDEFSEAFSCAPKSQMNPSNKCVLW